MEIHCSITEILEHTVEYSRTIESPQQTLVDPSCRILYIPNSVEWLSRCDGRSCPPKSSRCRRVLTQSRNMLSDELASDGRLYECLFRFADRKSMCLRKNSGSMLYLFPMTETQDGEYEASNKNHLSRAIWWIRTCSRKRFMLFLTILLHIPLPLSTFVYGNQAMGLFRFGGEEKGIFFRFRRVQKTAVLQ